MCWCGVPGLAGACDFCLIGYSSFLSFVAGTSYATRHLLLTLLLAGKSIGQRDHFGSATFSARPSRGIGRDMVDNLGIIYS